eukprot:GHVR01121598.1.p1 GENE.GHVR01121598.1~~GHVR01121598.1.p1  ORF type:complete len:175 (+),score=14.25 GHVR01121598.1:281-805(+)
MRIIQMNIHEMDYLANTLCAHITQLSCSGVNSVLNSGVCYITPQLITANERIDSLMYLQKTRFVKNILFQLVYAIDYISHKINYLADTWVYSSLVGKGIKNIEPKYEFIPHCIAHCAVTPDNLFVKTDCQEVIIRGFLGNKNLQEDKVTYKDSRYMWTQYLDPVMIITKLQRSH